MKYDFDTIVERRHTHSTKWLKFSDPNIIDKRIKKTKIKPKIFPNVKKSGKNFYTYPYWMGETFYSEGDPLAFKKLLTWLETTVWSRSKIKDSEFKNLCKNFYQEKTISRISKFSKENTSKRIRRS